MHLSDDMVRSVGFVVRNDKPVGTCFLVRVQSELQPDWRPWDHGYLITAQHVAPPDGRRSEVWMPTRDGRDFVREFEPDWHYPDDSGEDIAAARFVRWDDTRQWSALETYRVASDKLGISPRLGTDIQYVGLLEPIASMAQRGQPMARVGSLGAVDVEDVSYGDWCAKRAHLIDCRSRAGFSGSPCFVTFGFPGRMRGRLPEGWREDASPLGLGTMYFFTALFGMLVGYADSGGVGVVLPIESIHDILQLEDFVTMRREQDEEREARQAEECNGFEAISADDPDRVSLVRLEFEEPPKRLLATPDTESK